MARVRVPQADGEIVISGPDGSRTYRVHDHEVTVNADHLDHFLRHVAGSKVSEASPRAKPEKGEEG